MRPKGFTLIELLVVISIMAILLTILGMNFFGLTAEARQTKAEADLRVLKISIDQYAINKMFYPATLNIVEGGDVLPKLPKDPFTENDNYNYFLSSVNGNYYAVWSTGLNGISGSVVISPNGVLNDTDDDDIGLTNGACPNKNWR